MVNYYVETDTLYIDLSEQTSVESEEVADGIVLDYDAAGNVVGMEIESASRKVQLDRFEVNNVPRSVATKSR